MVWSRIRLGVQRDVGESRLEVLGLLRECILGDRLESDVDVDALLGRCLEVWNIVLRLAPLLGAFR